MYNHDFEKILRPEKFFDIFERIVTFEKNFCKFSQKIEVIIDVKNLFTKLHF